MDSQETKLYIAILVGAIVLGIILVYFIITMIRHHRINVALYRSKIQAEIITLEKERSRVARDLHDELAPTLLTVKYNMNGMDVPQQDADIMERSNELLEAVIKKVREISHNLLPDALLRKGLIRAVEDLVRQTTDHVTGLETAFNHSGLEQLDADHSVHIYRIIQEIINNTIKHAGATALVINLVVDRNTIILKTEDDGGGFDYNPGSGNFKGIGLRSLLSRADFLGGTMYLDTKAGKGTRYIFEFPV